MRSKKLPVSEPLGAPFASGIVPPCKLPELIAPIFAAKLERVVTVILFAVMVFVAIFPP